jgi:hypothetical protein
MGCEDGVSYRSFEWYMGQPGKNSKELVDRK